VRIVAGRIYERLPNSVPLEDLISTGVIGLLSAIDHFDPSFGVQLNTYAEHRIYGAIMDSLRSLDWAPRETRRRARLIEGAIHNVQQRLRREPSEEEIAAELGVALAEYQRWLSALQTTEIQRLEYASPEGPGGNLLNFLSGDEDDWPCHLVERAELERILAAALERIPKKERTVLTLYYYEELMMREIAEIMGMHLSRIGQLRVQGILRLRGHLERVWKLPAARRQ
jgi:RNA polymerase sigma factor for flagellar operon FliA